MVSALHVQSLPNDCTPSSRYMYQSVMYVYVFVCTYGRVQSAHAVLNHCIKQHSCTVCDCKGSLPPTALPLWSFA